MSKIQLVGMIVSAVAICVATIWTAIRIVRGKDALLLALQKEMSVDAALAQTLAAQLTRTTAERQDATRKAEEYRALNESVLRQRDQWTKLYDQQAISHGNAQVWMLEELERLVRQLRSHGVQAKVSPAIREAHGLFLQEHVNPVLARTGIETVHQGNPPAPGDPAATPEGQG